MNRRSLSIVISVVLLHALALWALHSGLLQRMVQVVVPVMLLSQTTPPPEPLPKPEPKPAPAPPKVNSAAEREAGADRGQCSGRGDRKSTRLNSSHTDISRMPSSA